MFSHVCWSWLRNAVEWLVWKKRGRGRPHRSSEYRSEYPQLTVHTLHNSRNLRRERSSDECRNWSLSTWGSERVEPNARRQESERLYNFHRLKFQDLQQARLLRWTSGVLQTEAMFEAWLTWVSPSAIAHTHEEQRRDDSHGSVVTEELEDENFRLMDMDHNEDVNNLKQSMKKQFG